MLFSSIKGTIRLHEEVLIALAIVLDLLCE